MNDYGQVFWGLISTSVAFLLGLAWRYLTRFVMHRRARHFWRPLLKGNLSVVLGRFRDLTTFEASGVVGAGDNIALNSLISYFARVGFKQFTVFYNDQLGLNESDHALLHGNLILLGGPDANVLTRSVLQRLTLGVEFLEVSAAHLEGAVAVKRRRFSTGWPRPVRAAPPVPPAWRVPVFLDKQAGRMYAPAMADAQIRGDCGLVIRCPNPFNQQKEVMIFCGCYGYGTWGAVQFVQSKEFLAHLPKGARALECVFGMDVVNESPLNVRVEFLRALDRESTRSEELVIVPRIMD